MDKLCKLETLVRERPELIERFLSLAEPTKSRTVVSVEDAFRVFWSMLGGQVREMFAVVAVNHRNQIIDSEILTTGSQEYCIVDPRLVYRWALTRDNMVYGVVIAHNHPSGNPNPSPQDVIVTQRMLASADVIGIPMLDHLIIGNNNYFSFAEMGLVKNKTTQWVTK
jgi:DNA repair protein RadC